jgi:hypothetical protein
LMLPWGDFSPSSSAPSSSSSILASLPMGGICVVSEERKALGRN